MKTIFGTVTEELTVTKDVRIEVPADYTEFMIEDAIRSRAYKVTINDFENEHGWLCTSICSVDVEWEEGKKEGELPYSVNAGRYNEFMGKQSFSTSYSDAFATMDEALEAFDKCRGYPWQRLSYKGRVLMGVEP